MSDCLSERQIQTQHEFRQRVPDVDGAEEYLRRTPGAAAARDPAMSADVGQALLFRSKARRGLGNLAGANEDLTLAVPSLENGLGAEHPDAVEARKLLAQTGA